MLGSIDVLHLKPPVKGPGSMNKKLEFYLERSFFSLSFLARLFPRRHDQPLSCFIEENIGKIDESVGAKKKRKRRKKNLEGEIFDEAHRRKPYRENVISERHVGTRACSRRRRRRPETQGFGKWMDLAIGALGLTPSREEPAGMRRRRLGFTCQQFVTWKFVY